MPELKSRKATAPHNASHTQRRGDARRHRLLQAASALLERQDPTELTFAAVCAKAGVPVGSARFFYSDTNALLRALLMKGREAHDLAQKRPLSAADLKSWRSIVACQVARCAQFQRANPIYAKLSISGKTLPELKRLDREADRIRSGALMELLDEHFVVPKIPDLADIAYFMTEIVDLAFTLSVTEAGEITPKWLRHAIVSAVELLAYHFGGELQRRPEGPHRSRQKSAKYGSVRSRRR